jgi:hypothetical protein
VKVSLTRFPERPPVPEVPPFEGPPVGGLVGVDPGCVEPGGVDPGGVDPGCVEPGGVESGGVDPGSVDPGNPGNVEPGDPGNVEPGNPGKVEPGNPGQGHHRRLGPAAVGLCEAACATPAKRVVSARIAHTTAEFRAYLLLIP